MNLSVKRIIFLKKKNHSQLTHFQNTIFTYASLRVALKASGMSHELADAIKMYFLNQKYPLLKMMQKDIHCRVWGSLVFCLFCFNREN